MNDQQAEDVLRRLRSDDPREAWARFLELYSPLLFDLARRFERDEDPAVDCYLFVCGQLSANGFRRLLRFRPGGPAPTAGSLALSRIGDGKSPWVLPRALARRAGLNPSDQNEYFTPTTIFRE